VIGDGNFRSIVHDVVGRVQRTLELDDRKEDIMMNPNASSSGSQTGKASTHTTDSDKVQSRTIKVDGMTGDTCVQKVSGALKSVEGVTTKSVTVGSVTIEADRDGYAAACSSIKAAGFKVQDSALDQTGHDKSSQGQQDKAKHGQPLHSAPSRPGSEQGKHGDNRGGSTPPPIPQRAPAQPTKAVR
jgi:copper chaperone CopZ